MLKAIKKNQKGFTLVELVIVVAILAILALLLVPKIMGNVNEAKKSKELANARTVASQITTNNAYVKVDGSGNYIPKNLPTKDPVLLQSTDNKNNDTYYDGTLGALPDPKYATITVDLNGNAVVVPK